MDVSKLYPKRQLDAHKGQFGRLLVIAGSKKYTGSPILNAMAALRSGCDLVTIATPERLALVAALYTPDIITYPLRGDYLSVSHIDELMSLIESDHITAVVMGGGLGRNDGVFDAIESLISHITPMNIPLVLDAEALRCIGRRKLQFNGRGKTILTPNRNEILDLLSVMPAEAGNFPNKSQIPDRVGDDGKNSNEKILPDEEKLKELITKIAKQLKSVVLLKGHVDLISDGHKVVENSSGTPFMTKGGFGDTLAGVCGALLARGVEAFATAQAAAYINGKAGEIAAAEKGEGVLASDLFETIPQVIA